MSDDSINSKRWTEDILTKEFNKLSIETISFDKRRSSPSRSDDFGFIKEQQNRRNSDTKMDCSFLPNYATMWKTTPDI